jgi:hypothetical protein
MSYASTSALKHGARSFKASEIALPVGVGDSVPVARNS